MGITAPHRGSLHSWGPPNAPSFPLTPQGNTAVPCRVSGDRLDCAALVTPKLSGFQQPTVLHFQCWPAEGAPCTIETQPLGELGI